MIDREIRARAREDTDLLTPHTAAVMERTWRAHQRAHDDAIRLHAQEMARPRDERVAEQRAAARAAHHRRRIIPPGPTTDETEPPF